MLEGSQPSQSPVGAGCCSSTAIWNITEALAETRSGGRILETIRHNLKFTGGRDGLCRVGGTAVVVVAGPPAAVPSDVDPPVDGADGWGFITKIG